MGCGAVLVVEACACVLACVRIGNSELRLLLQDWHSTWPGIHARPQHVQSHAGRRGHGHVHRRAYPRMQRRLSELYIKICVGMSVCMRVSMRVSMKVSMSVSMCVSLSVCMSV